MEKRDWERVYKNSGIVQNGVLDTVVSAVQICCDMGCKRILDLGCGTGRHTIYIAEKGFDTFACDAATFGIKIARQRLLKLGLNAKFCRSDYSCTGYKSNSFDAIICVWTSGHGSKADVQNHIAEMHRVVRPGGLVFSDFVSKADEAYGRGTRIEEDTFINISEMEADIPHHFSTHDELTEQYHPYSYVKISDIEYVIQDTNHTRIRAFWVEAKK